MTVLHIDSDKFVYAVGFACQHRDEERNIIVTEPLPNVLYSVKRSFQAILEAVPEHTSYQIYLTGGDNFRLSLYPEYKANRKTEKPVLYHIIREYMVEHWNAIIIEGMEADDAVAMAITADPESVCVSEDKDLRTVPGRHLNPRKLEEGVFTISEEEALMLFYTQMLMGDSTDNIAGLITIAKSTREKFGLGNRRGCGVKSAEAILKGLSTEEEMYKRVLRCYYERELESLDYEDVDGWEGLALEGAKQDLLLQGRLLHMGRALNEDGSCKQWELLE